MINPIDKDKVAEYPGLIPYPHTVGSMIIKPEDTGKLKSRALSAMREQTEMHLKQIQKQVELLASQANDLKKRIEVSEMIYMSTVSFEPFVGHVYYLYRKEQEYSLMMIGPDEWGRSMPKTLEYINTVKLLSDHTWQIL